MGLILGLTEENLDSPELIFEYPEPQINVSS
jgi:hypothetical protein